MRRTAAAALGTLVLAMAGRAHAEDGREHTTAHPLPWAPQESVALQLVGLLNNEVAVEYEHRIAPRLSLAPSLGGRLSGGADFSVVEGDFGFEARAWILGRDLVSRFYGRGLLGPYVGARLDYGLTRDSAAGQVLGTTMSIAEGVAVGWRFALFRWISVTPSAGVGLRTDFAPHGRLAPWTRPELGRFALYAGILF